MGSLKALATNLAAAGGTSSNPEIIVASLDGKTDAATWVKRAKAVISAAGPFSIHGGEYVVKAAAENGVHYSDTSDKFHLWPKKMKKNMFAKFFRSFFAMGEPLCCQ